MNVSESRGAHILKKRLRDFSAEVSRIRFRHLGFAFFWVWMSLFMYRETSVPTFADPQMPLMILTLSSSLTLVFIVLLLPGKMTPVSSQRVFQIGAPCLVIAGTLFTSPESMLPFAGSMAASSIGSFLAGIGMILIMIAWAEFYGSIGTYRAALYMPISLLLATPFYYLITLAPSPFEIVLMCCCPIFATILSSRNKDEVASKDALACLSLNKPSTDGSRSKSFLYLPWKIVLAAGLYGVISGLVGSTSQISGGYSDLAQIGSIAIAFLLVLGLMFFGNTSKHAGFTYKPTLFVMAAGCIALLLSEGLHNQLASVIIRCGYMLFYALSWIMYSDISFRLNLPSHKVFASGRLFGSFGYALGMGGGFVFSQSLHIDIQKPEILAIFTLLLLFFTAVFVLDEKDVLNTWGQKPREVSPLASIASEARLTPRELDVLELLAKGRSMPYIEDALSISYSTVNSHTAKIYQKLGVHSKQELISLIERESESF